MSSPRDAGKRGPGRPPNLEHRTAVLEATRRLIPQVGYAGLTLEAVAREAGLYRRYINRTWGSKAELVRDAAFGDIPDFVVPDTGAFATDLEAYVHQYVELNLRPEVLWGLPSLQVELINDPNLLADTLDRYVDPAVGALRILLERAVAAGDLGSMPNPALVISVLAGSIQQLALRGLLGRADMVEFMCGLLRRGVLDTSH